MKRLRGNLTYSNVISTICLILLVGGGTAYAATKMVPKNSVGTKQIRNEAVTPAKLSKAAERTLTGQQGPSGPQGDKGDRGEKGDQGARGPSNAITKANSGFVPWSTTYTTIESMSLDAGSWVDPPPRPPNVGSSSAGRSSPPPEKSSSPRFIWPARTPLSR